MIFFKLRMCKLESKLSLWKRMRLLIVRNELVNFLYSPTTIEPWFSFLCTIARRISLLMKPRIKHVWSVQRFILWRLLFDHHVTWPPFWHNPYLSISGPIGSGAPRAPNPGGPRVPGVSSSPEGLRENLRFCVCHQFATRQTPYPLFLCPPYHQLHQQIRTQYY